MKPRKSILNPSFHYVPAAATDLGKTFARIRRQLAEQKKKDDAIKSEAIEKVRQLGGRDPK